MRKRRQWILVKEKMLQLSHHSEAILAFSIIGLILLLIVPLPPIILDLLLAINIVLSVITLLLTIYIEKALDFNAFPSLLLFLTLFRLGLNIASTRMILLEAKAGDIIATFGGFVTQGSAFVGTILFALLTFINFIVITKGANRVAEVAARFMLESLPGKQMGVDADLTARTITKEEGETRRNKIFQEAEFYGSMDGASKFVRGDAIASIMITFVNLIGGLFIGWWMKHLHFMDCVQIYSLLTIGDGLVTQIPALLISLAAGIMVTRASSEKLGRVLPHQIFNNPKVLIITGILIILLSFLTGMPKKILFPLSFILLFYGWKKNKFKQIESSLLQNQQQSSTSTTEEIEKSLIVYPLEIELGLDLISYSSFFLSEMSKVRSRLAKKLGIILPSIHISDSLELSSYFYLIKIKGVRIFQGSFSIEKGSHLPALEKIFEEQLQAHSHELLNRQEVLRLIENARQFDSAVIDELLPKKLNLGGLLKILQNLLKEGICIRDFISILEILADHIPDNPHKDEIHPDQLSEIVRQGLSKGIFEQHFGEKNVIYAISIDPQVEQMLMTTIKKTEQGTRMLLRPITSQKIIAALNRISKTAEKKGISPVVLTQSHSRLVLRRIIEKHLPSLAIFSYNEVAEEKKIEFVGKVTNDVLL